MELFKGSHRLVLSNEIIVEVTKVLRYPDFQRLYGLSESDLLEYSQLLQSISDLVILDPRYRAPLRDPSDLVVRKPPIGAWPMCCARTMAIFATRR